MANEWVVLLEAAGDAAFGSIDAGELNTLHETLEPGHRGGVLHSPDRYALQVTAMGASPIEALLDVAVRWADAVRRLGLPAWKLVRTEVFTPEDLERELEMADRQAIAVQLPEGDSRPDGQDDIGHELLRRAFSDPLTGLLGDQAFRHRLEAMLAIPRPVGVVSLGLDGFQGINGRFGGARGDEVLIALAQRLAAMLRPTDVLARLAGDEYGVILEACTQDAAQAVAERMLDTVRLPMSISGEELILSASAGVALSQPGENAEAVLDNVHAALAAAKAGGRGLVLYGSDVSGP